MDILEFAQRRGIIAGVCGAARLEPCGAGVPFVSTDTEKRVNPEATLPGVKSIIVVGVGCVPGLTNLSSLGTNTDYHVRVRAILREIVREMEGVRGAFKYKILVDSPALDERALAHRAGLGFFGRNGLLISKKFGSRFNVGCLLTTLEAPEVLGGSALEPPQGGTAPLTPAEKPQRARFFGVCSPDCKRCVKSCPNNALGGENLRFDRCISYLTQKDNLSPAEEKMLHGQFYGCDICQDVCPHNAHSPRGSTAADPKKWLEMSDADFREKYGHTAMLWRGTEILRRNARLAL